jgi:hypothetical protein
MRRGIARNRTSAVLCIGVVGALAAACSSSKVDGSAHSSAHDTPPAQSIQGMLGLVPNNAGVTKNPVTVNLYAVGAKVAGLSMPAAKANQATVTRFYTLLYSKNGMPGSDLSQQLAMYAPDSTKQLGLDPHDVGADVSAGGQPDIYLAARGQFDRAAVDRAVHADKTWSTKLRTPTYDKTTVYSWLDDNRIDMNQVHTGLFTDLGGSRRVALPDDSSFVYGRNDPTVHAGLDATTRTGESLTGNQDFSAAAKQLDEKHAYSAILTATPPSVDEVAHEGIPGSGAAPSQEILAQLKAEALGPYRLAGIGVTSGKQQPTLVIVLVSADAAAAKVNVGKLRAMIQRGTSVRTQQPWSQVLDLQNVEAAGRLTVAMATEKASPNLWSQLFQASDTLLMHE